MRARLASRWGGAGRDEVHSYTHSAYSTPPTRKERRRKEGPKSSGAAWFAFKSTRWQQAGWPSRYRLTSLFHGSAMKASLPVAGSGIDVRERGREK